MISNTNAIIRDESIKAQNLKAIDKMMSTMSQAFRLCEMMIYDFIIATTGR